MTKRTAAKYKIDRRMGENIWGRAKSPLNKREYGPGQHGQRRKNKLSDFGTQLRAKQKLKGYYGDLTEKQFRRIYAEAERVRGDTGENLIGLLERRLDAVVYRAKFVPTIFAARQFVNHGHVEVNGKRVNIASYRVKEGDVISVPNRNICAVGAIRTRASPCSTTSSPGEAVSASSMVYSMPAQPPFFRPMRRPLADFCAISQRLAKRPRSKRLSRVGLSVINGSRR